MGRLNAAARSPSSKYMSPMLGWFGWLGPLPSLTDGIILVVNSFQGFEGWVEDNQKNIAPSIWSNQCDKGVSWQTLGLSQFPNTQPPFRRLSCPNHNIDNEVQATLSLTFQRCILKKSIHDPQVPGQHWGEFQWRCGHLGVMFHCRILLPLQIFAKEVGD